MRCKYFIFFVFFMLGSWPKLEANEPDSAYVFAYTTAKQHNTAGLHYAWSINKESWHAIGPEFRFLFCDFGAWGSQKKMINPFLFKDKNKKWHCVWTLNNQVGQFAHAATDDLCNWESQSYPEVMQKGNVQNLEVAYDQSIDKYVITWLSNIYGKKRVYKTTTSDFKSYTLKQEVEQNDRLNLRDTITLNGEKRCGTINKLSWKKVKALIDFQQLSAYHEEQRADNTVMDAERFKDLHPVKADISIFPAQSKTISDMLIGVFFEDINYAADGGLYAELIQNRDFEYTLSDKRGRDASWTARKAWRLSGTGSAFSIDTVAPVHPNNKHYAILDIKKAGAALINEGYNGIPVKKGEKYDFSVFAKVLKEKKCKMLVHLTDKNGNILAESKTTVSGHDWKKLMTTLIARETCPDAKIELIPQSAGTYAFDMVSLFPQNTFRGNKNGLRADLAQAIADIHPRFVRFPGGCVSHGNGLKNMYHWNRTIGPLEARVPNRNLWNYHQSVGLGYYEYFQFCEDIGAEPVPVVAAGVPCQNSSVGGYGQQGGIPMCEMDEYVQEVLDLIEWANGDKNTKWGKLRAEAGHPEPFNLKYIGIGNEDLITDVFKERFTMIFNAVKEKYPAITVIGTVGPFNEGTDYVQGWKFATKLHIPIVDEHYYQTPGWFIHNQDFYDRYDRSKSKVYLGEYAAHLPGRPNNIESALTEALYLTSVERNADIVTMASYAPLLAKEGHTQWNPDLIYFNNTEVKPTVGYYVQKLFGNNSGDTYIPSQIKLSDEREEVKLRVAVSVVEDSKTNDLILKLVNLLPVEVNAAIDLSSFSFEGNKAILSVLTGTPTDKKAKPVESTINVSDILKYNLSAYSLSVVRIKR